MTSAVGALPASMAIQWGVVQITWGNFILLLVIVVVFVLALLLPFPTDKDEP